MKKERKWSREDFTKQERKTLFYLGLESKLAYLAADLKTDLKNVWEHMKSLDWIPRFLSVTALILGIIALCVSVIAIFTETI